jgi:hypothetical protein
MKILGFCFRAFPQKGQRYRPRWSTWVSVYFALDDGLASQSKTMLTIGLFVVWEQLANNKFRQCWGAAPK